MWMESQSASVGPTVIVFYVLVVACVPCQCGLRGVYGVCVWYSVQSGCPNLTLCDKITSREILWASSGK